MARLVLVGQSKHESKDKSNVTGAHRAASTEGEAARQLLEQNGYPPRRQEAMNGQYEHSCPFHEEPGSPARGKSTNFYLDKKTSQYQCHAASCAEKGNLQTLEKFFGIQSDPTAFSAFKSREAKLQGFQGALSTERRQPLYEAGLTDSTIDRFRIGWDEGNTHGPCFVIPYLEARRPEAFRFYSPDCIGPNGSKYWWEAGTESRPFNVKSALGNENGQVIIAEGEKKAMLLEQWGYAAIAVPGAQQWKREWSHLLNHAREIIILFDNDSPEHHVREIDKCAVCRSLGLGECEGHNPGQEAAVKLKDMLGFRAKNVVLPLPDGERKTDINEYAMRDQASKADFEILLAGGDKKSPFLVRSLSDIFAEPPAEAHFLIDQGVLPKGGRLLVSGSPKVGKSILVEDMALSLASGIPFLRRFGVADINSTPGIRTLLLDREVSERSLYERLKMMIDNRPGYQAAMDNLFVDHKFRLTLDGDRAEEDLCNLVFANGAQVVILDTAYKFFGSTDMNSQTGVAKAFAILDRVIDRTGVSVVLTHHHRKGSNGAQSGGPSADSVVGSFLWTGWPNGTILLNFKDRRVDQPFNTICSFTAFRDAAPPEPLVLYRNRDSVSYTSIEEHHPDDEEVSSWVTTKQDLTVEAMANLMIKAVPVQWESFVHMAAGSFGVREDTIKPLIIRTLDEVPDFVREGAGSSRDPYVLKYAPDHRGDEPSEVIMVSSLTGEVYDQPLWDEGS